MITSTFITAPLILDVPADAAARDIRWSLFLDYWHRLAGGLGHWPRRRDLDPIEMGADLLGNVFLIDIEPAGGDSAQQRYRFRLLGDEITEREIVRPGMYLDELGPAGTLAEIERHYADAIAGRVRLRETTLQWEARGKEHVRYSVVMLPLLGDAGVVAHLIGCAIYEDERRR